MRKKIALFIDAKKNVGGAFQESLYLIQDILKNNKNNYDIVIVSPFNQKLSKKINIDSLQINLNLFQKFVSFLRVNNFFFQKILNKYFIRNYFEDFMDKNKIDLIIFLNASQYIQYVEKMNFIVNIPDLAHRKNHEFPEMRKKSEFEIRERIYSTFLPKAFSVVTNSSTIKRDLVKYYSLDDNRVSVINHQPSQQIQDFIYDEKNKNEVKKKYNLPDNYIFFPAQYWIHKNHKYIIDAIKLINDNTNINYHAVFCGSDKGNLDNLKNYSRNKKIDKKIKFLDFVSDEDIGYLYILSKMLVMPSYFGPTNIPPLEAFYLRVPVIYPNFDSFAEEFGESVFYIDIKKPESLVKAIKIIDENDDLRNKLINNGLIKLNENKKSINENRMFELIKDFFKIYSIWKND